MNAPHPTIVPQPGVMDIAPYVGGEAAAPGANRAIKLSSNENPYGPSPRAIDAYRAAADSLAVYPDGGHAGCAPPSPRSRGWRRTASSAARAPTRSSPSSARPMRGRATR